MNHFIATVFSRSGKVVAGLFLTGSLIAPAMPSILHAADTASPTAPSELRIGDNYGGGKVAYIFRQGDRGYVAGQVHGLIAAKEDLGTGGFMWDKAIKACLDLKSGGYSDWRLPSKDELNRLYESRFRIGGFIERHYYWTSTESDKNDAWDQSFRTGEHNLGYKLDTNYVRPVRSF